jgi:hypothetical protein
MKRLALILPLPSLLPLFLTGCPEESGGGGEDAIKPYREAEWVATAERDFPYTDADGVAQILELTIGGNAYMDNFANRGDVIVEYTLDDDKIRIWMRRFTMAQSEELAQETFDKLELWAFNTSTDRPKPPGEMPEDANCLGNAWLDGCAIRVYFDGQSQLARAGADIKVQLPKRFRHQVNVITQDANDDAYHNRGNVCIDQLNGSADVELESGVAYVVVANGTDPVPTCSPEDNDACAAVDWDTVSGGCPCAAGQQIPFGVVSVETEGTASANAFVDVPGDLWVSVTAQNEGMGDTKLACTADAELADFEYDVETVGDAETRPDFHIKGWANRPQVPNLLGGFSVDLASASCSPVAFTEQPENFTSDDEPTEQRGNLFVGSDFIRGTSCDDVLASVGEG